MLNPIKKLARAISERGWKGTLTQLYTVILQTLTNYLIFGSLDFTFYVFLFSFCLLDFTDWRLAFWDFEGRRSIWK